MWLWRETSTSFLEYWPPRNTTTLCVVSAFSALWKKTHSPLTSCDFHLSTNLLYVRNDSCCQELPITFHISIHQEKRGNLCIILKPIVAYLVGREHVFPTGCAFVCGSASFKFSFIPALLPTLWPIISCNIGHPRLCEALAPFAFLIQMEHSWSDCRYGGGKLRRRGGRWHQK